MKGNVGFALYRGIALIVGLLVATAPSMAASRSDFDLQMEPVLAGYLAVQTTLAAGSLDGVQASANKIAEAGARLVYCPNGAGQLAAKARGHSQPLLRQQYAELRGDCTRFGSR